MMKPSTKAVIAKDALPKIMKGIRRSLMLSQDELSQLCGISRQSISYYESGKTTPEVDSMDKWLVAIKAQIRQLRYRADNPPKKHTPAKKSSLSED